MVGRIVAPSDRGRLGFPQCRNLKIERCRIELGVIVREEIERHCRDFAEQLVQRGRIRSGGNVVAVPLQTDASSSQAAEIVKITGFCISRSLPLR
jgi:hypothetical protein